MIDNGRLERRNDVVRPEKTVTSNRVCIGPYSGPAHKMCCRHSAVTAQSSPRFHAGHGDRGQAWREFVESDGEEAFL
jgi:hypothetical protein